MARLSKAESRTATLARRHAREQKTVRVTSVLDFDQLARDIHAAQRVAGVTR